MSNLFSCPFPSLQMLQPLGSQSPLCLFSNSLSSHRDKLFPAFGFGAQVPPDWQVSTVFASPTPIFSVRVLIWGDVVDLLCGTQLYVEMQGCIPAGMCTASAQDYKAPIQWLVYTIVSFFFAHRWSWGKNLIFILALRSPMNLP